MRSSPRSLVVIVLLTVVLAGCGASAPSASPTEEPTADPFAVAFPIPPELVAEGEFEAVPKSQPGLTIGTLVPFELEHCGLMSPVDVDGSLWEPVRAMDAQGGPVDTDSEMSDLINPASGEAMLVTHERLDFRAERSGVVVVFRRHDGPRRYPICS
jgi:hypothetical protein